MLTPLLSNICSNHCALREELSVQQGSPRIQCISEYGLPRQCDLGKFLNMCNACMSQSALQDMLCSAHHSS